MIKSLRSIAVILVLLSNICAQATPVVYNFSETLLTSSNGSSKAISGRFTGEANGNLITNLSNVSVTLNGVVFGEPLFTAAYAGGGVWYDGAVVSFDGKANNFLFINSDLLNGDGSFNQYFSSLPGNGDFAYDPINIYSFTAAGDWLVTAVPEPGSIFLVGLGLMGVLAASRKNRHKA